MKKILWLLILSGLVSAQISVKTVPNSRSSFTIMDNVTITGATSPQWSTAFPVTFTEGATAIFFNTDTTGASVASANQSDSCLTVFLQIKNNTIGWTGYYNDANNFSRLDSVARSKVNAAGTNDFRLNLADFNDVGWGAGDSARVGLTIGVGDSIKVTMTRQGF